MSFQTSFGSTEGRNVLAGNRFAGDTTINIGGLKDSTQTPQVCRAIHFPRNDDFVQRSAVSEQIAKLLPPKTEYQSAAIWGLGGAGKTQLALEYAYSRCSDPTCSIFWVHADTRTSFIQDYKWIATKLGIASDLDGDKLLTAVRTHIETLPHWVLVLDNADDLALFGVGRGQNSAEERTLNLSVYIPRGTVGTVLWTSRDQRIVGSLVRPRCGIKVVRMTQSEAEVLFQAASVLERTEDGQEHDDLAQLLVELDWLPLAITQAAAYIRRTSTTIAEYLQKIQQRKNRWKLLKRSEDDPYRRPEVSNSILETWNISMEYIKQENELAYDILTVLAYVDNQNIPFAMIVKIAQAQIGKDVVDRRSVVSNSRIGNSVINGEDDHIEDDIMELVVRLEEFSFLVLRVSDNALRTRANRAYEMHKLVQEAISYNLYMRNDNSQGKGNSAKIAFEVINELFPENWQRETWAQCEQYLGHTYRTAEWAREYGGEEDVAVLLFKVSTYLYDRGRWREKEIVDIAMLNLRKGALGEKHPDTLVSQAALAVTYNQQGRYKEAAEIKEQVLKLRQEVLGEEHADTLWSKANLAITYYYQGRYNEAEKIYVEVLALQQEILGSKHPSTIDTMEYLASTYFEQRRHEKAEKMEVEVLKLRQKVLGSKHPNTILGMANLASTYTEQGRYNESEKMYMEVLALQREILGSKHPDTIDSMALLATTYHKQRRYEEAEEIDVEVLELYREILGSKHPETISSMANLASTYYSQNRFREAEKIWIEVLRLRREVLGEEHPDTIKSAADVEATHRALEAVLDNESNDLPMVQMSAVAKSTIL